MRDAAGVSRPRWSVGVGGTVRQVEYTSALRLCVRVRSGTVKERTVDPNQTNIPSQPSWPRSRTSAERMLANGMVYATLFVPFHSTQSSHLHGPCSRPPRTATQLYSVVPFPPNAR